MNTTTELTEVFALPKATIYTEEIFGFTRTEVRDLEIHEGKYAQYDHALRVRFTPKGKRKQRGAWLTYKPTFLVMEGWGVGPEPRDAFKSTGPISSITRHGTCSPEWEKEMREQLVGVEIAFDARGWNSYTGEVTS